MTPWEKKAHRIIAALAFQEWKRANVKPDGTRRKRHVPYSLPGVAQDLVDALGMHDRKAAEEKIKAIMLYSYDVQGVL